ncbi:MAG TPA: InlB B-repeat-containing protein, partial [Acholeplasmataceae bacterium]|nr:InlB B-repeat-containing protein [Acholeplasmataceae bacterium]
HAQVIELYTESNTPGESTTPPTGVTLSGSYYQDDIYFNEVTENPFTVYPAVYIATTTGDTFDLGILVENMVFVSTSANIRFYIGRSAGGEENIGGVGDFVISKDETNIYITKLIDDVEQEEVYAPLSDFGFLMIETIPPAAETWTVSFMSEGVILSTQEIDDLSTASIPTAPTRAGYNFVNWVLDPLDPLTVYEFATPVTADLTLYAYWEPNGATVYEVSFITDGGTAVSPIAVEDGDLASAPTPPIRSGYTFLHWVVTGTSDVFSFSIPITGNLSLTAVWEESGEVFYIITFIENGGSTIQDQIVNDGDLPVEPTDPTRTGYLFMGWYSDIALTSAYIFDAAPTADMTLYAKWTPVSGGGDPIAEDPASSGSVWLYVGLGAAALAVLAGSQANPKKGKRR